MKILLNILILFSSVSVVAQIPLHIDAPERLKQLENSGYSVGELAFGLSKKAESNKELLKSADYEFLAHVLQIDFSELMTKDSKLGPSMKKHHRLFDERWLGSDKATFELVGVVHRLERSSFNPGTCGELRFIYRLAYKVLAKDLIYSRLPMTMNLVFTLPKGKNGSCTTITAEWKKFVDRSEKPKSLTFKSVEVNLQSVRWPSTIRPDMGGYAEYILRVFKKKGPKFYTAELENTPDVMKLKSNPALKEKLMTWLKEPRQMKAVDEGVLNIPAEFLATRAVSVALTGTHRLANAPFTQVFTEEDFKELNLTGFSTFKSAAGLFKRLNDHSCMGCHQGRTVAGFHFLGKDRAETDAVNAIFTSASPHFLLDQPRRMNFFEAAEKGKKGIEARPVSVRAKLGEGGMGSHCGLGDPSFSKWICLPGFECARMIDDNKISPTGVCMPIKPQAGSYCLPGKTIMNTDPHKDAVKVLGMKSCGEAQHCEAVSVGFPGGMCSRGCTNLTSDETCGSIAVLHSFNSCLARRKDPFAKCLSDNVRPAALQACDDKRMCRDDYICARTGAGVGACIPPYFLFQLRVDGHPEL